MQLGLRSAKTAKSLSGSYAFFRSGDFVRLLVSQPDGTIEEDFTKVIGEIRCDPDEPEIQTSEKEVDIYYNDILKLRDHFSKIISTENRKTRIEPEVRKAHNRLREIINKYSDNAELIKNANKISKILNSYFPHHLIAELKRLNKFEKDDDRWYEELVNLYNKENLGQSVQLDEEKRFPIEFICGEIIS